MKLLNKEFAAVVVVDAMFSTDENTAQKHGVSVRTIQRWRKQLSDGDSDLTGFVASKKAKRDAAWADELPVTLAKGLEALERCFSAVAIDPTASKTPEIIHAIAGALKILTEAKLSETLINARLGILLAPNDAPRFPRVLPYN